MNMDTKIKNLVKNKYQQAAFTKKANAVKFENLWKKQGYETGTIRSFGKTVEGDEHVKSYYVIADKPKQKIKGLNSSVEDRVFGKLFRK